MVPKNGCVWSVSTVRMSVDYQVQPFWVTTLYAGRKITYDVAKRMYAAGVVSAETNLRNLETVERYRQEAEMEEERGAVDVRLRLRQKPFRVVPQVAKWMQTFEVLKDRYAFLVLDGPSQVGKTRFVASLTGPQNFLCIDCACVVQPDLRCFRRGTHKVVLYDEMSAEVVIRCKMLFQSGADLVRMGSSSTNMYAYAVWMHQVMQVVCSNKWREQVTQLPAEDRSWLEVNCVHLHVERALWQE